MPSRAALARRARHLAGVLARHGLGYVLDVLRLGRLVPFHQGLLGHPPRDRPYRAPEHLRMALEDLGPTFVKIGQLLSTRSDLLPAEYQAELARLQDAAPPEPAGTVEAILAGELGRPAGEVFASVDPEPLAAASIGQAHAAALLDGTPVVVKVRRPGAVELIEVDLAVLERAAALLARYSRTARRLDLPGLVAEMAGSLRAELDYTVEAANAERFARHFADDPAVHIPRVHRAASSRQVITLDRICGTKFSEVPAVVPGADRAALARVVVDVVLRMVFEHGFFHADPHPGNLFLESDGRLGIIDFGMVGSLDRSLLERVSAVFLATAARDAAALGDELLGLGVSTGPVDRVALGRDLADLVARFGAVPLSELRLGVVLQAEMAVVRRHRFRLPPELALLARAAAVSEGVAGQLDPSFQILPAFQPYAARLLALRPAPGAGASRPAAPPPAPA